MINQSNTSLSYTSLDHPNTNINQDMSKLFIINKLGSLLEKND